MSLPVADRPPGASFERTLRSTTAWSTLDVEIPLPPGHVRMLALGERLLFHGVDPGRNNRAGFALMAP